MIYIWLCLYVVSELILNLIMVIKMTRTEAAKMDNGNCYVEYDEDTGMWCVFGVESGFAYSSHGSEDDANKYCEN